MNLNMGPADRVIRLVVGAVIAVLYGLGMISGTVAIVLGVIALIFIATSFMGTCPAYLPFGLSTKKKS